MMILSFLPTSYMLKAPVSEITCKNNNIMYNIITSKHFFRTSYKINSSVDQLTTSYICNAIVTDAVYNLVTCTCT